MQAEINNFRGIKRATLDLNNIALIGASNASGKSSIAQALGALLTGNAVPVRGVTKATAGQLVHAGTASGSATLTTDDGSTSIVWPKATCTTEGAPPSATDFAAGLSCVLALAPKDRAKALAMYLDADPTRDDLEAGLEGLGLSGDQIDKLWEMIEAGGWDGAHEQVKAKGAKLKGQWEQITGQNYGIKKAASYVPDGWEPNLDGESEDALAASVVDARELLEAAIANDAIDEDRRQKLEDHAAMVPELQQAVEAVGEGRIAELQQAVEDAGPLFDESALAEQRQALETATAERDRLAAELLALPIAKQPHGQECPSCGGLLHVVGGKIEAVATLSELELGDRTNAIEVADGALAVVTKIMDQATVTLRDAEDQLKKVNATIQQAITEAETALNQERNTVAMAKRDAETKLNAAKKAAKELAAMPEPTANAGAGIDAARGALTVADERLKAWKAKTMADQRANSIAINVQIVSALKPAGIRQKKLAKAMSFANAQLKNATAITMAWGVVALDGDLEASLNGTPYSLLSKSERYRCRVALQVWMALTDNSAAVIIDGADVLVDSHLRNDLFAILTTLPIPSVVTMALVDRAKMPDLGAAGIGESFWIEAGELQSLTTEQGE